MEHFITDTTLCLFYMIVFYVHNRVAFISLFHGLRNAGFDGLSDLPKVIANAGTEIQIQIVRFHSPGGSRRCQMVMCRPCESEEGRLRLREDVGHGGGPPPYSWMKTLILYKWHPGAPSSPQKTELREGMALHLLGSPEHTKWAVT